MANRRKPTKLFPIVEDYLKLDRARKDALAKGRVNRAHDLRDKMERLYSSMTAAAQRQLS